jgi:hypothetical protein
MQKEKFCKQKTSEENCQHGLADDLSGWRGGRPYRRTGDGELFGSCASASGRRRVRWESRRQPDGAEAAAACSGSCRRQGLDRGRGGRGGRALGNAYLPLSA